MPDSEFDRGSHREKMEGMGVSGGFKEDHSQDSSSG